jgi:hypothetical protein
MGAEFARGFQGLGDRAGMEQARGLDGAQQLHRLSGRQQGDQTSQQSGLPAARQQALRQLPGELFADAAHRASFLAEGFYHALQCGRAGERAEDLGGPSVLFPACALDERGGGGPEKMPRT